MSTALSQTEHFVCTCGLTDLQWPLCVSVECPIPHFSVQKGAREWPLCALDPHFCRACTGASSAADFYPTVKEALRHESADREGFDGHL